MQAHVDEPILTSVETETTNPRSSPFNEETTVHVTANGSEVTVRKKKFFEPKPKLSKKRQRNPDEWKRNKAAKLRQSGQEYLSQTGKLMKKKEIKKGVLCKEQCRLKCSVKFNIEDRETCLKRFYSLDKNAKNSLLFKSMSIQPVARHRHRSNTKPSKNYTFKYMMTHNKQIVAVCKDAFCSLYQIGRKKVEKIQSSLKLGQSVPSPDKQGHHRNRPHKISNEVINCIVHHIKQFPAENSHYSRNKNANKKYLSPLLNVNKLHELYKEQCRAQNLDDKYIVKVSFYRHIFETKFNYSFGYPKSDTCSVCDAGENSLEHKENWKFAYESQKIDRQLPSHSKKICYITMDLQQTMPLPKLSTSKAFYLRQMWLYNFGIHCIKNSGPKSYFFTWTENIANRGSNEVASCLFRFCKLLKEENPEIDHLIIWSDSCAGQNKNFFITCLYQFLILNNMFKVIEHKFPEVGHSYLDSDRDFGRIEKVLRKHQNIYTPDQYRGIITSASTKGSVCINMEHFFFDFEALPAMLHLFKRLTNTVSDKIQLRDKVKWIRVEKFANYLYKSSLDPNTPFLEVDLHKKGAREVEAGMVTLRPLPKCGGLTAEKMSNLRDQMKFIEPDYRWYYEEILEENTNNPKTKKSRKSC